VGSLFSAICACVLQVAAAAHSSQVPAELAGAEVRALEVDSSGAVWVGVEDRGLGRIRDGIVHWEESDQLPRGIADLTEVRGTLWAAGLGGASRRQNSDWRSVEVPGAPRVVFSVSPGSDPGELWFGTSGGAVHVTEDGVSTYDETNGLPHRVVHQAFEDRHGAVWFLCRAGVARLVGGRIQAFYEGVNFRSGLIGPDGLPWFGTSLGLLRWTGSGFVLELEGITIYPRLVASDGSVWVGSASEGVLRHDGAGWTRPIPELLGHEVFDVAEGPSGEVWIGSAVGLRVVNPGGR
jgi:ligand-binding sensor domain-containing protein